MASPIGSMVLIYRDEHRKFFIQRRILDPDMAVRLLNIDFLVILLHEQFPTSLTFHPKIINILKTYIFTVNPLDRVLKSPHISLIAHYIRYERYRIQFIKELRKLLSKCTPPASSLWDVNLLLEHPILQEK
jgi:hypothetical protein